MRKTCLTVALVSLGACASDSDVWPRHIFFSDGYAIRVWDPDGSSHRTLVPGTEMVNYPTAIAVDPVAKQLYWTDNMTDAVSRVGYDGAGPTVLYTSPDRFSNPNGVAVDAAHDRLFWTEGHQVRSAKLDGTQPTIVAQGGQGTSFMNGVAVLTSAAKVCWADNGNDTITCGDYDGSNAVVVYSSADAFSNPRGLTIDPVQGRLYWGESNSVKAANLDGTNVATIFQGAKDQHFPEATAVVPEMDLLFWTDNGTDALHVADRDGLSPRDLFQNPDRVSNPCGVAVDVK